MKKFVIMSIITAMLLTAAGCGGGGGTPPAEEVEQVYVVDLCYIDEEYAATGNEDIHPIRYFRNQHIYALPGKQYLTLLDVVLRDNQLGIGGTATMITDRVRFNSVEVRDGTAYVDLAGANLSGGSLEEGLLISQIVYSLTGSFDEVERVQFLIDGEAAETLMGHYSIEEPFEMGTYPLTI